MRRAWPWLRRMLVGAAVTTSVGFAVWSVVFVDGAYLKAMPSRVLVFPATTWKPWLSPTSQGWWWSNRLEFALTAFLTALAPGLAVLMISRVSKDGPRVLTGPGFAALVVGCLFLTARVIETRVDSWIDPPKLSSSRPGYIFWHPFSHTLAPAIFGVWAWTFASDRWRARPTWTERLSRLYGWGWIALLLWREMGWSILWG